MTRFLGLDFADLALSDAAEAIAERPAGAPFAYVVTPNADHLVRLRLGNRLVETGQAESLRAIYRRAALCLLDSRAVALLAALFRLKPPPVVAGSELTERLLAHHVLPGERIVIIGLSPVWLPALIGRYDLAPPAHYDPPMSFERNPAEVAKVVAFLKAHPARFVFLAVGSPRQERLAALLAETKGVTGMGLCIGASLEFLCGARRRAPRMLQRCGLEWVWRLVQEPRRLSHRYLVDSPKVIALLWRQRRMTVRLRRRLRA
ncbi:MAG TPA: WecB/TagA/CpsF family glycosyltransferase [Rhodopila sp.]|jgi:N-acetylglucosaminyldiphosphoundecaprenol N-acetyl-beta-D-mannosaminyltransferase|nr:WecB/TagA/CpsF family glycosyltransferase [Rhodopila sp.]